MIVFDVCWSEIQAWIVIDNVEPIYIDYFVFFFLLLLLFVFFFESVELKRLSDALTHLRMPSSSSSSSPKDKDKDKDSNKLKKVQIHWWTHLFDIDSNFILRRPVLQNKIRKMSRMENRFDSMM